MKFDDFKAALYLSNQNNSTQNEDKIQTYILDIQVAIEQMLHWKNRFLYLELFDDFSNNKMNSEEFSGAFIYLIKENMNETQNIFNQLKVNHQENIESKFLEISKFMSDETYHKIGQLLSELYTACNCLTLDETIYKSLPSFYLNEKAFKIEAQRIISNL